MKTINKRLLFIVFLLVICFAYFSSSYSATKEIEKGSKEQLHFLRNTIDRIIKNVDPNANLGIEIISLKNGQTLYQKNAHHMFVPGSSLKIFTATAALAILGADFQFETKIASDGIIKNGMVQGNLYLKGSGDPSLSFHDLENLVFQLILLGIHEIKGDLFVDHFDFDGVTQGPGWMWDEGADYWNSPIDGLTVDHSCVNFWIKPASSNSEAVEVKLCPKTDYITMQNLAVTAEKGDQLSVNRKWVSRENFIQIDGSLSLGQSPKHFEIPIESPHLYAAFLLRDLLKEHGITLTGEIKLKKVPINANDLAVHRSVPLSVLVHKMMKTSDNLYANCLFKKMGQVVYGGQGSWEKGGQAVKSFLSNQAQLDVSELVLLDGDGLSRYNLISPHQIASFLTWIQKQFLYYPEFIASLPIAGVDGTLKGRMEGIKSKVRAKTGTMTGITSLSGYITTKDDEMLAFCIMVNGFIKPGKEYKEKLEDQICTLLAQFSRR